jgi:hypothetical protein
MSRVKSILVGLVIAFVTLVTWEVVAATTHHSNPPPQTAQGMIR